MSDPSEERTVVNVSEPWSELTLEDGTRIKYRLSVAHVERLLGKFDGAGEPIYTLRWSPINVMVLAPAGLRRPSPIKQESILDDYQGTGPASAGNDERRG